MEAFPTEIWYVYDGVDDDVLDCCSVQYGPTITDC